MGPEGFEISTKRIMAWLPEGYKP